MANSYQKQLLRSYPRIDLLNLDPENEAEVEAAVAEGSTGDTLFDFMWKEFADHEGEPVEHVLKTLDQAARDIFAVRQAVLSMPDDVPAAPRA
jgi:hypothetical protein